jgi:hypothetical protein
MSRYYVLLTVAVSIIYGFGFLNGYLLFKGLQP